MDYEKEYKELKKEFDRLFAKLYLAEEENKLLLKENKKMKKKMDLILNKLYHYASRLGEEVRL